MKTDLSIRRMTGADLAFGLGLSAQAGWNQLAEDWQRALELEPEGCFVADEAGQPVGTTTTCRLGTVGWIALVLVEASRRGRGIGTALMRHALAYLERQGCKSIWLDATTLGQPLYEKLGFQAEFTLLRFEGQPRQGPEDCPAVRPLQEHHFSAMATLDQRAYGHDRSRLLNRLVMERPEQARGYFQGDQLQGFRLMRPGSRAMFLGPCVAVGAAGRMLLAEALGRCAGPTIFVDVPATNEMARADLEQHGFQVQRQLVRMRRGEQRPGNWELIWCSAGPEKG